MCGIAGILSLDGQPARADDVRRMCAAMQHRGPDDEGVYRGTGVALGMRRLSIIDLQTGHQPVSNEDGSVWVVLNGEIYNYRELRRHLESRGHRLATRTDTETIAHLYEVYGPNLVAHLRGMFAFALWDERRRQLLLARDRLGIKPLYYGEFGSYLVFASEVKAVLQAPFVPRELDWHAVDHLFTSLTTPRAQSIIRGVRKLEPAHLLRAAPGAPIRTTRYWDLSTTPDRNASVEEHVELLRAVLDESIRLHMVSDVPTGAFLSGGIDSSAVVAGMTRHASGPVSTFSIGFDEPAYDERLHARRVATHLGTDHHELMVQPDALEALDDIVWHLDEPFGDSSAIPTYAVSRLASEHITVVLSGDGGDELFAGYDKYRVEERERRAPPLPAHVRKLLGLAGRIMPDDVRGKNFASHFSLTGWPRYLDAGSLFRLDARRALFRPEVMARFAGHDPWREAYAVLNGTTGGWLAQALRLDLDQYLPLDILTKVDRMSMAHAIEARVPLLDHHVVEVAAMIPPELKLADGTGKWIFKRALRGLLPDDILDRPKQGFAVPLGQWFRGRLEPTARELLLSPRSRQREIFDPRYVERLIARHRRGRPLDLQLWTLMCFELWCRIFLDEQAFGRDPRPVRRAAARRSVPSPAGAALA